VKDSGELTKSTACGRDFSANTLTPSTTAASRAFALRDSDGFQPFIACRERSGKGATDWANTAIQRQFTEEHALVERFAKKLAHASSQSRGHRQIEARAFFSHVGGSEVDGYPLAIRKFKTAISQCRLDALAAFFDGVVWEAHHVKVLHARGTYVHLNFDEVSVDSIH
jgi:hypothetical protein